VIITRTPSRVSLFGGGSDYGPWYSQHGGATIGFAIPRYTYISARFLPQFFAHKFRVVWSKVETVQTVAEIDHPAVRAVLEATGQVKGLEIHHDADLPHGSGMGSGSAFVVGLLQAIHALGGHMTTPRQLAEEAIQIERECMGETVGVQDQIFASHGGFNRIDISRDGAFTVSPVIIPAEREKALLERLLLFFTGHSRHASEVAAATVAAMPAREKELHRIQAMVDDASATLAGGDLRVVGELLHEGWRLKRSLAPAISKDSIDLVYAAARDAGAVGGKLLGAGGGGFMLCYVEPERQKAVRKALSGLIEVEVGIDREGSRVVVYQP
jgi:D-glycero-alpha-D-manno-heptose-7-phosphate kinase